MAVLALLVVALGGTATSLADTPLRSADLSPDVTTVARAPLPVTHGEVLRWDLDSVYALVDLGPLPAGVAVDAFHFFPATGHVLLSFDTPVELADGMVVGPADVVRFDGEGYKLEFVAAEARLPGGLNIDAVTASDAGLLLSFDTDVRVGEQFFADEDLVLFERTVPTLIFDGSKAGIPVEADLDAAHYLASNGRLLCSFDVAMRLGELAVFDEDVVEWDPELRRWELAIPGIKWSSQAAMADLDALAARAIDDDGDGRKWTDDCDDADRTAWSLPGRVRDLHLDAVPGTATALIWFPPAVPGCSALAYDVLRSPMADRFGGTAAVCIASGIQATTAFDGAVPPPGEALFFLVRGVNGCGDGDPGADRTVRTCFD